MFSVDINEYISKKWPTKTGYVVVLLAILFFILTIASLFATATNIHIAWQIVVVIVLIVTIIHDTTWRFFTGRISLLCLNKIVVAVHPNILRENDNLIKLLKSLLSDRKIGHWFKIMLLPEDLNIENNQTAEKYVNAKKTDLLIWGETISGQENGKELTHYRIKFSYSFNYPSTHPAMKYLLLRDFNEIVRERYWKANKDNSLKDISEIGDNLVEVGLYIIAICLLSRGSIKYGLNILEELYSIMRADIGKHKLKIYPKIRIHLLSLYNLLSIVAWREERNMDKSIVLINKMFRLDENNYDGHLRMTFYEYLKGNLLGSRKHFRRCKNINPRHPCTLFDQAFFYILDGEYEKATKAYKKIEGSTVDGLVAFEVAYFLEEEYQKNNKEIGLLFAAGFVNTQLVGHKEIGIKQLKKFCSLAKGKSEYNDFFNKAQGILQQYRKRRENDTIL